MTKRQVLIVGEDDLIAWAIRKRFSAMQIPVRVVQSPHEAREDLREGHCSLVVFDTGLLAGVPSSESGEPPSAASAARSFLGPGDEGEGDGSSGDPLEGIRVVEKPLNIFDLDRVVEGMIGRYSEKRRDPRYTCNIPVSIFLQEEEPEGKGSAWGHPTGVAAETSEDGLRVFTSHVLVPGQRLRLTPLSAHSPLTRLIRRDRIAEVVWVVPDEEGVIAGLRYLS